MGRKSTSSCGRLQFTSQVFKEERLRGKIFFIFYVFAGIFTNSLRVYKIFNAVFQYTGLYILIWLSSLANPQFFDVLLKKKKKSLQKIFKPT